MKNFTIILLSSFPLVVMTFLQNNGEFNHVFFPAVNQEFPKSTIKTNTTRSHVTCARDCSMTSQCVSFNFHQESHLCQLNNASREQYPQDLIKSRGSVYFDTNKGTAGLSIQVFKSCKKLLESGYERSSEYTIFPNGFQKGLKVYCDMENDGGGWIVIQRRQDGTVDFYRDWETYKAGFGNLSNEFWIGNENLRKLSELTGWWTLRVNLLDWVNNTAWVEYGEFGLTTFSYRLHLEAYNDTSSLDTSLNFHKNKYFSTFDRENDSRDEENCAKTYQGGWWYGNCLIACFNGQYYEQPRVPYRRGIHWGTWKGNYITAKESIMKIK
ncbi:microfibril-associated glycoprotein 4-like [Asterias amurensis]|uniref:microfibril-associated glycoprotein 4-like n=1 Tax=Asterias amurensis TaxID=7602 RepID=UPI003AB653D2